VWILLALLVLLWLKATFEERRLAERFPGYRAYAAATPRLIPNSMRCLRR
jgi:protein-S-isoprenylcysteine O-methyltransferase Ste14